MSSQEGSALSSASGDSEAFGAVARGGFTRMYVLLHSALDARDTRGDYRPIELSSTSGDPMLELDNDKDDEDHEDPSREGPERFHLLYASGRHYFHGDIEVPEDLVDDEDAPDPDDDDKDLDEDDHTASKRRDRRHGRHTRRPLVERLGVEELPVLLPHFQAQQDALGALSSLSELRAELRDVVYHMEEVGEFLVEELSKDKILARLDEGSREFHWMVSPENPTFFELQTYPRTNTTMADAGVVVIVMKMVLRGVLLDVIYHRDSYFVTLRENDDELALEDTFIPNLSCVGPCYLVRRYSDTDLKQLLLWCSFPSELDLTVEGKSPTKQSQAPLHLPAQAPPRILKVAPNPSRVSSTSRKSILQANDTQLYCLFPTAAATSATQSARTKSKKRKKLVVESDADEDEGKDDEDEGPSAHVVFQFNQFLYHGSARIKAAWLEDLGRLSTVVLPSLRHQALASLAFYGAADELDESATVTSTGPSAITWQRHLSRRLEVLAPVLLELVLDSQAWVREFLDEVDAAARSSTTTDASAGWLGRHLRSWLENPDGTEFFYELELRVSPGLLWGLRRHRNGEIDDGGTPPELMVWKGLVHQAVLVLVYRRGSFFIVLRELEDLVRMPQDDGLEGFGLVPPLEGKGRGYLVRQFPPSRDHEHGAWLAGAKLLLWQTVASVAREDLAAEEAQTTWLNSPAHRDQERATAQWFQDDKGGDEAQGRSLVRPVEPTHRAEAKAPNGDDDDEGTKDHKGEQRRGPKVGKRHHLAPLQSRANATAQAPAPWDLRTGRPV